MAVYRVEKAGETIKDVEADRYFVKDGLHRFRRGQNVVYSIPVAPEISVTMIQADHELGDSWPRPR